MFTKKELTQIRLQKLGMNEPLTDPIAFMQQSIALQSQNHQPALVNLLQHTEMSWYEIEELFEAKQVIKIWANRLTLHTFLQNDWELVFRVFGTRTNIVHRICKKEGVDLALVLARMDALGRKQEIVSRKELEAIIGDYSAQLTSSIIAQATIQGIFRLLPSSDTIRNYSHRIWLGDFQEWTADKVKDLEAMMTLIRRYLAGYGPATWQDFRHWSGLNVGEIKEATQNLADELDSFSLDAQTYFLLKNDKPVIQDSQVFLTGKFDQAVIAYKDSTWIMTEAQRKSAWTVNGHCSAIVVAENRAVALWKYEWKKNALVFTVSYFEEACFESEVRQELQRFATRFGQRVEKIEYVGI